MSALIARPLAGSTKQTQEELSSAHLTHTSLSHLARHPKAAAISLLASVTCRGDRLLAPWGRSSAYPRASRSIAIASRLTSTRLNGALASTACRTVPASCLLPRVKSDLADSSMECSGSVPLGGAPSSPRRCAIAAANGLAAGIASCSVAACSFSGCLVRFCSSSARGSSDTRTSPLKPVKFSGER